MKKYLVLGEFKQTNKILSRYLIKNNQENNKKDGVFELVRHIAMTENTLFKGTAEVYGPVK